MAWIGHASFVVVVDGLTLLVDPVFSSRIGLLYRRHGRAGLTLEELGAVDGVLVTHSHYDHLDWPSLSRLPRATPIVVPSGLGAWFRRRGFGAVEELAHWERCSLAGLQITLTPARHWSRRTLTDTNRSLWGGFVVAGSEASVYHAGDSGWFDGFAEIGRRFPGLAAALLPAGGYEPRWFMGPFHMDPEEAGRAFLASGARRMVPMHWGAFQLTDEPLAEPADRVARWWKANDPGDGRRLHTLSVGEILELGS